MCCDEYSIGRLWLFAIELRFVCGFQTASTQIGFSRNRHQLRTSDNIVSKRNYMIWYFTLASMIKNSNKYLQVS